MDGMDFTLTGTIMTSRFVRHRLLLAAGSLSALGLVGCGGGASGKHDDTQADRAEQQQPAPPAGKVIAVKLTTDEKGNYFSPSEIEAHKGDILRFTLVVGVHNVDFVPDSNPGRAGLPPVSDMLQLPGQTLDIPLTFGEGTFYFQCDPHAALGMKGHVKVE